MSGMNQAVSALAPHFSVIDGVNATTQTLTGISPDDTIIRVFHFTPGATATLVDVTTHLEITDDDEITVDADYSSDQLLVVWHDGTQDPDMRQAITTLCLRFTLIDGVNATTQTLTGITELDVLLGALHFSTKASITAMAELTLPPTASPDLSITDDDEVTFSFDATNDQVLVIWNDSDATALNSYGTLALQIDLVDGHATEKALTGILAEDVVLWTGHFSLKTDIATLDAAITATAAAAKVTYSADCANDLMMVVWLDRSA